MKKADVQTDRATYRHGNLRAEAIRVGAALVAGEGHENLSIRQVAEQIGVAHRSLYNHFENRDSLLDAVAENAFGKLAVKLRRAESAAEFTRIYARYALKNKNNYALMTSRRHATMKNSPDLQTAVHQVITEALRVFGHIDADPTVRRRQVMRQFMLIHGALTLHAAGILDLPNDKALLDELTSEPSAAH
jgi:AcrR family transcriptional regulator